MSDNLLRRFLRFTVPAALLIGGLNAGCDKQRDLPDADVDGGTDTQPAEADNAGISMTAEGAAGVDDRDDPSAPRALPMSGEVRGWVKVEPILPVPLDRLAESDASLEVLESLRIDAIFRCRYANESTTADVTLIQAATPADAFGAFSVITPQDCQPPGPDGSVQAVDVTDEAVMISGWQGRTCVRVSCSQAGERPKHADCDRLTSAILFNLRPADAPLLMRMIPQEKLPGVKIWVVRSVSSLARARHPTLRKLADVGMDKRLRLDGQPLLSVARVPVAGENEPPNLIWLVEYPDAEWATAVYERYTAALSAVDNDIDARTILQNPQGVYLAGSWTAGQESLQNLLPRLREALPEPPERAAVPREPHESESGWRLVFELDTAGLSQASTPELAEIVVDILEQRVDPSMKKSLQWRVLDWDRFEVLLQRSPQGSEPANPDELVRLVRGTGVLEFRILATRAESNPNMLDSSNPAHNEPVTKYTDALSEDGPVRQPGHSYQWFQIADPAEDFLSNPQYVTAEHDGTDYILAHATKDMRLPVSEAAAIRNVRRIEDVLGRPALSFELDDERAKLMQELTERNINRPMGVLLDGKLVSAATIMSAISGKAQVSGHFTAEQVDRMARKLDAGALPARVKLPPLIVEEIPAGTRPAG